MRFCGGVSLTLIPGEEAGRKHMTVARSSDAPNKVQKKGMPEEGYRRKGYRRRRHLEKIFKVYYYTVICLEVSTAEGDGCLLTFIIKQ
jgi:hypothetical protein